MVRLNCVVLLLSVLAATPAPGQILTPSGSTGSSTTGSSTVGSSTSTSTTSTTSSGTTSTSSASTNSTTTGGGSGGGGGGATGASSGASATSGTGTVAITTNNFTKPTANPPNWVVCPPTSTLNSTIESAILGGFLSCAP